MDLALVSLTHLRRYDSLAAAAMQFLIHIRRRLMLFLFLATAVLLVWGTICLCDPVPGSTAFPP
jgi:hypothetical protein